MSFRCLLISFNDYHKNLALNKKKAVIGLYSVSTIAGRSGDSALNLPLSGMKAVARAFVLCDHALLSCGHCTVRSPFSSGRADRRCGAHRLVPRGRRPALLWCAATVLSCGCCCSSPMFGRRLHAFIAAPQGGWSLAAAAGRQGCIPPCNPWACRLTIYQHELSSPAGVLPTVQMWTLRPPMCTTCPQSPSPPARCSPCLSSPPRG